MTNTKAYGWAVSTIHHVVLLGVGGQARGEGEDVGGWAVNLGLGGEGRRGVNSREGSTEVFQ